jgi:hypothetical protein
MTVVIKGLPAGHCLAGVMGVYVEQLEQFNGHPSFVSGRHNELKLALYTLRDGRTDGTYWIVSSNELALLRVKSDATLPGLPHLIPNEWCVLEQRKVPSSSIRIRKFRKRETIMEVSGLQGYRAHTLDQSVQGIYRKQGRIYNDRPTYMNSDCMAIWSKENFGWCVGDEKDIGTRICTMHADDFAPTPDAVQSTWMVQMNPVEDPRVQAVLTSTEPSPSQQRSLTLPTTHVPAGQQEEHAVQESSLQPQPLMVLVAGVAESGYDGLYAKQLRTYNGRVLYESTRADGNRVIWYQKDRRHWVIGPVVGGYSCGPFGCIANAQDAAVSPLAITAVWNTQEMGACNSIRVTKSKKKFTKVIEVKGVPNSGAGSRTIQLNGKYRQQARIMGGRPTFKGGKDGQRVVWYSACDGSWCVTHEVLVGTSAVQMMSVIAKDTAATPDAVNATWQWYSGEVPNPYINIVLPSVEAAEQEMPRQMHLKMTEVMVAEEKRCLGCGHQPVHNACGGGFPRKLHAPPLYLLWGGAGRLVRCMCRGERVDVSHIQPCWDWDWDHLPSSDCRVSLSGKAGR